MDPQTITGLKEVIPCTHWAELHTKKETQGQKQEH